jgi:hypothetical protein
MVIKNTAVDPDSESVESKNFFFKKVVENGI